MIHYCTKRAPGEHRGWKRFYSIGRWEPRKGFDNLIYAFLHVFKPGDKASLTIKYSGSGMWPGYATPDEALETLVRFGAAPGNGWSLSSLREHIRLIDGRLKRSMICKLHYENNIYVSASHGEAFGLPAMDSKLAGNAMVYVPYGGVADLTEDSDIAIPYEMGPVDPSYRWEHGAKWASYRVEDLAEGLRRAEPPEAFRRPPRYEQEFSLTAVGRKMRDLVDVAVGPETYQT
jgi:glycosyltransferase involved in cell wall biosynthesis